MVRNENPTVVVPRQGSPKWSIELINYSTFGQLQCFFFSSANVSSILLLKALDPDLDLYGQNDWLLVLVGGYKRARSKSKLRPPSTFYSQQESKYSRSSSFSNFTINHCSAVPFFIVIPTAFLQTFNTACPVPLCCQYMRGHGPNCL